MWVDAGFDPDTFWHQTPRSFQVAMEGVRKRLEREAEMQFRQAYETASFTAVAMAGKLKKIEHYLKKKPEPPATAKQMLAALKAIGGSTMTVRKVPLGDR
jgi:hypothetical protein